MFKKYSEFINTITEMYLTNVKQTAIIAKLRKYQSSLEEATDNDEASIKVYDTLIEGVYKGLEANHEYMALKKKLLQLEDMYMYDIYVNPFTKVKIKHHLRKQKRL